MGTKNKIKTQKQIKADLDSIGAYPYDEVRKVLQSLATTEERLNYLKNNDHYAKFEDYENTLNFDEQSLFSFVEIIKNYFPEESIIEERGGVRIPIDYRGTHIPSSIYEQFFRNNEYEVEWWLVKERAKKEFNEWLDYPETNNIKESKRSVEVHLNRINDKIKEVLNSNLDEIDINEEKSIDVELLRILSPDYYNRNKIKNTVETRRTYFDYVLKREYLQSLLNQSGQISINSEQTARNKHSHKDYALTYVFDLDVQNEQPPTTNGALSYEKLNQYYNSKTGKRITGNSGFVKGVKDVIKIDRNDKKQLDQFSLNWRTKILQLSEDNRKLDKYLKDKKL